MYKGVGIAFIRKSWFTTVSAVALSMPLILQSQNAAAVEKKPDVWNGPSIGVSVGAGLLDSKFLLLTPSQIKTQVLQTIPKSVLESISAIIKEMVNGFTDSKPMSSL